MKLSRLLVLVALFVFASSLASMAAKKIEVYEGWDNWQWSANDWLGNRLELELWWYKGVGELNKCKLWGFKDGDPIVSQQVRNFSTHTWTDWHIVVTNGTIRQDGSADIRKSGSANPWFLSYGVLPNNDGTTLTGWTLDQNEYIQPLQVLSIYFVFDPIDPSKPINIEQWPTSDYVPEPTTLAGVAMGVAAFGVGLRRRLR